MRFSRKQAWWAMPALLWVAVQCSAAASPAPAAEQNAAKPNYSDLYEKNIFDPNRQPWPEKSVAPSASVPPLNPGDVEVYGVMSVGSYKKAIIKLGPAFKQATAPAPGGRPFIMLAVGQTLGPYTLVEVTEKSIVLEGGGARFPITFAAKRDRPAAGPVAPLAQAPVVLPAPVPTMVPGIAPVTVEPIVTSPQPPAQAEAQPATAPAQQAAPTQGQQQQVASASPAAAAAAASPEAAAPSPAPQVQGRTLLEAIEAARQAQLSGTLPAPPPNPFVKQ